MDAFLTNELVSNKQENLLQNNVDQFNLDDLLLDDWSTMSPESINSIETNLQQIGNSDHDSDSGLGIYSSSNSPKTLNNENFLLNNPHNFNFDENININQPSK